MKQFLLLVVCVASVYGQNAGLGRISAADLSGASYFAGGGTAQAQTVGLTPAVTTLVNANGLGFCFLPAAANTGAAPTLSINGLAAKPITKFGTTALVANDLTTAAVACVIYDGTEFQLQNPQTGVNLSTGAVTYNGQTVNLGSTGNVNSGAAAHSVALNQGNGAAITGAAIGTAGRLLIDQGAGADPSFNAMGGDATITSLGAVTVGKVNGNTPGGTCTNQFTRSIDSSGRPTCASIAAGDLSATVIPPIPVPTPGTSITLVAPSGVAICTSTCTVTLPVPAAGYQFCIWNDDSVSTAITLAALGSSAMYENSARTAYGTASTGTLVVSAAAANKVCVFGRDSTHYQTVSFNGTVTVN